MCKKMKSHLLTLAISLAVVCSVTANAGNKNQMEKIVEQTSLYKNHQANKSGVEVWDDNYTEDGWKYYSIVSNNNGVVRKLEYIRIKDGKLLYRKYDKKGDDLWLEVK